MWFVDVGLTTESANEQNENFENKYRSTDQKTEGNTPTSSNSAIIEGKYADLTDQNKCNDLSQENTDERIMYWSASNARQDTSGTSAFLLVKEESDLTKSDHDESWSDSAINPFMHSVPYMGHWHFS